MSSERGSSSAPPPPIMGSPLDRRPPAKTLVNRPPHVARTASGGGGLPVRVPRGGRGGEDPRSGGGRVVPARCVGIPEGRGARALRGLRDRWMASVRWTVRHLAGPLRAGSGSGKRGSSSRARGVECQSVWGQPTAACSFRSFRWDDFSRSRDNHHSRHLSLPSFSSFIIHGWAASDIMSETCKACQTCPRFCSSRGPGAFCPGQAGEELPLPFKLKGRREAVASRKSARVEGRARLAPARHRVLGGFSLAGAGGGGGRMPTPPAHTRARKCSFRGARGRRLRPHPEAGPWPHGTVHPGVSRQQYNT